MLTEAYNQDVAQTLGRWVRVERVEHGLHIHNRQMDLTDHGDRITAGLGGNDKEIATMLQLAQAKGWKQLALTGSQDFQERAAAAALAAGFDLTDTALKGRILDKQRLKDLEAAQRQRAGMEAVRAQFEAHKVAEAGKQQAREAFERFKAEQAAKQQAEVERRRPKPEKGRDYDLSR
jgi:hypothetical protein